MADLARVLPLTMLLDVLACTVDSVDGATSLGDPSASTTVAMTTTSTTVGGSSTTAGSESSSSAPEEDASTASASATEPEESSGDPSDGSSGGIDEQPADGMYSACESAVDCFGVQGCAVVMPNVGFCTNGSCTDASTCVASPGGTAVPACVPAAMFNGVATQICALDCSGGKTCPGGMECTAFDAAMVCV